MIPEVEPYNNWAGDGTTTQFDFDFYIEDSSQLKVEHINSNGIRTTLTNDVDYTINEIGSESGSYITYPKAGSTHDILQTDEVISLQLVLPISQESEYGKSSELDLKSLEYSFDYLTRLMQILKRQLERAVKVQEGSDIDTDELTQDLIIVADNIDDVNTVSGHIGNVDTVKNHITNVDTVAGSIANVNKTGEDIANVNTVAEHITNIDTVADNINDVNVVSEHIDNVGTVRNHISNVDIVAGDKTNIDTVAGDKTNIDTVATNIDNVNTVKNSINNVNTVAADIQNVNTVAGDKTNIDTVAGDKTNIDTVATNIDNVNTVAGSINNVNTVAADIQNVNTVAGIDSDIVDVAGNENNITTVADNIEDVQNASSLIKNVYNCLNGGTASSSFTEGVSGGSASSVFTSRISGGSAGTVGSIVGDIQSNIRVIELNQRNDEADIVDLRTDLTNETSERIAADANLQTQIDEIDTEIVLINQYAAGLDERIIENTGDITEAFNQIHSNDDDILAIQIIDEAQAEDISSLQSDVGVLQTETKQVYSVLSGGTASSSFTEGVSGGSAASTFAKRVSGGKASSVGSLLADAYNLIRTLTSRLAEAFEEITSLKSYTSDLSSEIDAINSIKGISGGTATSVFS